jgi:uncharacterized protein (DUF433 family)
VSADKNARHYSSGMMAGVPVISGTRVPLLTLVEYLEDGRGLESFLADHPQVTVAQANRTIVMGLKALIERRAEVPQLRRGKGGADRPARPSRSGDSETE